MMLYRGNASLVEVDSAYSPFERYSTPHSTGPYGKARNGVSGVKLARLYIGSDPEIRRSGL